MVACACCCSADAAVSPAGTGESHGADPVLGSSGLRAGMLGQGKGALALAAAAAREVVPAGQRARGEEKRRRRTDVLWCQQSAQNEGRQASVFLSSHLVAASWELAWETMSLRLLISRIVSSRTSMTFLFLTVSGSIVRRTSILFSSNDPKKERKKERKTTGQRRRRRERGRLCVGRARPPSPDLVPSLLL